jgi:hypothetical protein
LVRKSHTKYWNRAISSAQNTQIGSKGYQAVILQYVNGILQSPQMQMEHQLTSHAHYTHKQRERKKKEKKQDKRTTINEKEKGKTIFNSNIVLRRGI